VYNVLFFPEDRIIKKPISDWVEELTIKAEQTRKKDDTITEAGTIAEILNQSALIYFSLGQYEAAKEICYLQINYFININKKAPNLHLLKYVMQPWVNLCRLDRAAGNINDLLKKLYQVANARQLLHALRSDPEFYSVLLLSRLLEPVKAYLKFNRYHELLRLLKNISRWQTPIIGLYWMRLK